MTEREEWLDLGTVVVPVSDVDTLTIENLFVLSGPVMPCRGMLDSSWERCLCR